MDPRVRRQRTFEAIKRLLLRESLNQPLMIIFEDLHWLDGETQAFLDRRGHLLEAARLDPDLPHDRQGPPVERGHGADPPPG